MATNLGAAEFGRLIRWMYMAGRVALVLFSLYCGGGGCFGQGDAASNDLDLDEIDPTHDPVVPVEVFGYEPSAILRRPGGATALGFEGEEFGVRGRYVDGVWDRLTTGLSLAAEPVPHLRVARLGDGREWVMLWMVDQRVARLVGWNLEVGTTELYRQSVGEGPPAPGAWFEPNGDSVLLFWVPNAGHRVVEWSHSENRLIAKALVPGRGAQYSVVTPSSGSDVIKHFFVETDLTAGAHTRLQQVFLRECRLDDEEYHCDDVSTKMGEYIGNPWGMFACGDFVYVLNELADGECEAVRFVEGEGAVRQTIGLGTRVTTTNQWGLGNGGAEGGASALFRLTTGSYVLRRFTCGTDGGPVQIQERELPRGEVSVVESSEGYRGLWQNPDSGAFHLVGLEQER